MSPSDDAWRDVVGALGEALIDLDRALGGDGDKHIPTLIQRAKDLRAWAKSAEKERDKLFTRLQNRTAEYQEEADRRADAERRAEVAEMELFKTGTMRIQAKAWIALTESFPKSVWQCEDCNGTEAAIRYVSTLRERAEAAESELAAIVGALNQDGTYIQSLSFNAARNGGEWTVSAPGSGTRAAFCTRDAHEALAKCLERAKAVGGGK